MRRLLFCLAAILGCIGPMAVYSGASAGEQCFNIPADLVPTGQEIPLCFQIPEPKASKPVGPLATSPCDESDYPFQASINPNNNNAVLNFMTRFNKQTDIDLAIPVNIPNFSDPNSPWVFTIHVTGSRERSWPENPYSVETSEGSATITKKLPMFNIQATLSADWPEDCWSDPLQSCPLVGMILTGCHDEVCEGAVGAQFSGLFDMIDVNIGSHLEDPNDPNSFPYVEQTADTCVVPMFSRQGKARPSAPAWRLCKVITPVTETTAELNATISVFANPFTISPSPSLGYMIALLNMALEAVVPPMLNENFADAQLLPDGSGKLFKPFQWQISHDGLLPIAQLAECRAGL